MTLENHQEGNAERLTRRELQVLRLMSVGNTNGQIAARLFISEGTVKSHVRHIMQKLEASNRTDAVARYHLSQQRPPSAAETLTP
nr:MULTISPECIES: response regulator transcription factor [unclassified Mycolicibacterium]